MRASLNEHPPVGVVWHVGRRNPQNVRALSHLGSRESETRKEQNRKV